MNLAETTDPLDRLDVRVGDVIEGKYRIDRVLGVGGMGVVLGAFHLQLEQPVALKFLLPEFAAEEVTRARFEREARVLARISSEHAARIMDVGSLRSSAYIVLEYLAGRDLGGVLDVRGAFSVEEAVGYVLEACEALAEAHALGIVHRDIKPENLFLVERSDGTVIVKVIDFGISKVSAGAAGMSRRDSAVTRTANIVGSPMYMSPEQLRNARDVDGRSDIWSLGVTLYELLTGHGPFEHGTVPELCASVLKDAPRPLRDRRSDVPAALDDVVATCLRKDRDERFRDVGELAQALAPFAPASACSVARVLQALEKRHTSFDSPSLALPLGDRVLPRVVADSPTLDAALQMGSLAPGRAAAAWPRVASVVLVAASLAFVSLGANVHGGAAAPRAASLGQSVLRAADRAASAPWAAAARRPSPKPFVRSSTGPSAAHRPPSSGAHPPRQGRDPFAHRK